MTYRRTAAFVLLLASSVAGALTLAPPVKPTDLKGAWIGRDESDAFYRITLDERGRGLLVVQEEADSAAMSLYRIGGTGIVSGRIAFALRPVGQADPTVKLAGEAYHGSLKLVRSGYYKPGNWKLTADLERENDVLPRILATQAATHAFYAAPKR